MRLPTSTALALILGLGAITVGAPTISQAQISIGISVGFAPPALPFYYQPRIPAYGYIWTPGYWAWDGQVQDYYWIPGVWVRPPRIGLLWTPGYWGWNNGQYLFNDGYWDTRVGFYGGINYGYGYGGDGYEGGQWRGGRLFYNRSVNNITNINITNVYNRPIGRAGPGRVSFNGGNGGVQVRPNAAQLAVARDSHVGKTTAQQRHVQAARAEPSLRAKVNHGAPTILASPRPGVVHGAGVVTNPGRAQPQGQGADRPMRQQAPDRPQGADRPMRQQAPDRPQGAEPARAPMREVPRAAPDRRPDMQQTPPRGGDATRGEAMRPDRSGPGPGAGGGRPGAEQRPGGRGPDAGPPEARRPAGGEGPKGESPRQGGSQSQPDKRDKKGGEGGPQ